MTQLDASIIILTKNGGAGFPLLLERILSQRYNGNFEVIAIDSGSTDGTLEAAGKFPVNLIQIKPEEFGHGRTRNLGADMSQGRYLVYITQDALPLNVDWLQKLTDNFSDPQVAMVTGRQVPREDTKPPEKFYYYYNFPDFRLRLEPGSQYAYHDNNFISSVNCALRRDSWAKYRFSETVVMVEDKEIASRIWAGGEVVVYDPLAVVIHSHDFSLKGIFERAVSYGVSLRQGAYKLPRSNRSRLAWAGEMMNSKFAYLRREGGWLWLPYMCLYDCSLFLGLSLGKAGLARAS